MLQSRDKMFTHVREVLTLIGPSTGHCQRPKHGLTVVDEKIDIKAPNLGHSTGRTSIVHKW